MVTLWRALYFIRTAIDGLRSSPVTSAVAVGTIATTLVVMGVFGLALKQMSATHRPPTSRPAKVRHRRSY